ncbi:MAG: CDP-diacylglycerol--serine O-phosphatidyltransferase [Bacteroidetes bacterium]|nr:CDP-diacylglycerol--serine O-phosphatidyltransferase [Bacteroidota bacterium]
MKFKYYIPNSVTLLNLVCGILSVTSMMSGQIVWAAAFIFFAAVFDFLDGTLARLLDARSELGKQLDSLADVVSFGVAPGIIVFNLLSANCAVSCNALDRMHITPYFALLIPVCSAIRLGKFNIDLRQEVNFIGLPTPANAIFFASIPLVVFLQPHIYSVIKLDFLVEFFSNSRVIAILTVFFSYLLVSEFKIFSIKFKTTGWAENKKSYILLISSLVLLLLFSLNAIPLIILLYLLLSLGFQRQI